MIKNDKNELETFKNQVSIGKYLSDLGYKVSQKSSLNNLVLTNGKESILIKRGHDGHDVFKVLQKDGKGKSGSIIDLVQHKAGVNLGQVRQKLRPLIGLQPDYQYQVKESKNYDYDLIKKTWSNMDDVDINTGDLSTRRVTLLLNDPRFKDKIKKDHQNNACFVHYDDIHGICGYEIRNHGKKGYSTSNKGLWFTNYINQTQLIICESSIDCLSYEILHPNEKNYYISFAGSMSPLQKNILKKSILKRPWEKIILALDNDHGGNTHNETIMELIKNKKDINIQRHSPTIWDQDWSDVLVNQSKLKM